MKKTITHIVDRHEGTFINIYRDFSDIGRIHYRPTASSMRRLARALKNRLKAGTVKIYETAPSIYFYDLCDMARVVERGVELEPGG